MAERYDVAVLGAGVAGMMAAKLAAERGLKTLLVEGMIFGGLVTNVNHLEPHLDGLPSSGGDLAADLMAAVSDLGVEIVLAPTISFDQSDSGDLSIETGEGSYSARSVIVATGARLRKLGVPGEEEFEHRGVSHCAGCDGPLFREQPVMIVGGGDSALQEAVVLAEFCPTVHLVHRGEAFSGRPTFAAAVLANSRITVHFSTVVDEIIGAADVNAVRLRNLKSGETTLVPCKGFFAYVGLEPNTEFLPSAIATTGGFIKVNDRMETGMANVYAIGIVRAGNGGEITDAVEDAQRAVEAACDHLDATLSN
jgi:thioredoxin reductase (NADPH)